MNLTRDPWIPALKSDGRRDLFSLNNLFAEAHCIRDLAVKPHERVAVMRLLICITQAALNGPSDEDEWASCTSKIQDAVRGYLEKWSGEFELFGDGSRFLQFPNLKSSDPNDEGSAATKLDLALATGNNATLFDNLASENRTLEPHRSALNILTSQCFATCGRIGVAQWNGVDTPRNGSCNHAPCAPSSMIHTLVIGRSLLETIHRNLLTRDNVVDFYGSNGWGLPSWELPVKAMSDKIAVANATSTYLGRLVPVSRAIRLNNNGRSSIVANGVDYPSFPSFREATATVIKGKDKLMLLPGSTNRSLWRQLAAVSVINRSGSDPVCGPVALQHGNRNEVTTLWVGALVTDKAKIEDVVESTYSLPAGMFTEIGRAAYEKGVEFAGEWERTLIQAVKTYSTTLNVESPPYDRARQQYWTLVEQSLGSLFDLAQNIALSADLPSSPWAKSVKTAAASAYERCCRHQTPRQIEAYAAGLRRLSFVPKAPKPTLVTP